MLQFGYGQGSANSANHHLGRDSSPRRSCLLAVSAARPNGLARVAHSLLIERARERTRAAVRRNVPAKHKFETFLQPRILLRKFRLFTVQIRHFAGENIARIANRVRAMALSLLQLRVHSNVRQLCGSTIPFDGRREPALRGRALRPQPAPIARFHVSTEIT